MKADASLAIRLLFICLLFTTSLECFAEEAYSGSRADRADIERTADDIRAAFSRGDLEAIKSYHHPDVKKALGYTKYLVGRDAVLNDLAGTLSAFTLEFVEHQTESVLFSGDSAIEQSLFTIRGTPKQGGEPFIFKGRALVVYVRYRESPSGWASIREVIQPAN